MNAYTSAILGGLMIGLSASLLLYGLGRIAGISGILSSILNRQADSAWRVVFIVGLLLGAIIFNLLGITDSNTRAALPLWQIISSGLLVGIGSVMGGGCTSGHGVCGLGRVSKRSIAATCTFVAFAMLSTYLFKHVIGL